jgi:hypothetical protein
MTLAPAPAFRHPTAPPPVLFAVVAVACVSAVSATKGTTLRGFTFSSDVEGERLVGADEVSRTHPDAAANCASCLRRLTAAAQQPQPQRPPPPYDWLVWWTRLVNQSATPADGRRDAGLGQRGAHAHRRCRRPLTTPFTPTHPPAHLPAEYLGLSQDICDLKKLLNNKEPPYKEAQVRRRLHY